MALFAHEAGEGKANGALQLAFVAVAAGRFHVIKSGFSGAGELLEFRGEGLFGHSAFGLSCWQTRAQELRHLGNGAVG